MFNEQIEKLTRQGKTVTFERDFGCDWGRGRITICIVTDIDTGMTTVGHSVRNPKDKQDISIGDLIALLRAVGKEIPDFIY